MGLAARVASQMNKRRVPARGYFSGFERRGFDLSKLPEL